VRFKGHMILRLESGAVDSKAKVAKSVLPRQTWAFILALKTQPGSLFPMAVLLGMMVPAAPRKPPVKSVMTKLLLPVHKISPHPPNQPKSSALLGWA